MIRIGSDTDIGIVMIGSELISIRYLRQGTQSDSILYFQSVSFRLWFESDWNSQIESLNGIPFSKM